MGERRGKGGRLAEKKSGRGLMKRETGSKGRKCANEKMAGNEDIGGERRDGRGLMKRETGSKRGGSVQMRKWQEMRRLAEKEGSGRCV